MWSDHPRMHGLGHAGRGPDRRSGDLHRGHWVRPEPGPRDHPVHRGGRSGQRGGDHRCRALQPAGHRHRHLRRRRSGVDDLRGVRRSDHDRQHRGRVHLRRHPRLRRLGG